MSSPLSPAISACQTALVNNAGIYPSHSILDMPEAAWDRVLDINLKGPFLCSQAFARTHLAPTGGSYRQCRVNSRILSPGRRGTL